MLLTRFRNVFLTVTVGVSLVALAVFVSGGSAVASDWAGGNGNWSSDLSPGWNGTGVPNAQGAVASNSAGTTATTTNDLTFVTVGTIELGGSSNTSWTFTTNGTAGTILLDQDGAGSGFATISNSNTGAGTTNGLIFTGTGGVLTLADDLLISNTSASTRTTGAISISNVIDGAGNVTFYNESNTFPASSSSYAGAIRVQTGVNTFVGNVLFKKGLVTFNNASSFGNASNVLTLGESGQGAVSLLATAAPSVVPNPIVVESSGGEILLGAVSTSTGTTLGYSGTILLNGDVTLTGASLNGNGPNFSNEISGVGNVTKSGVGIATLSGANIYTGTTKISSGTLQFATQNSLYNNQQGSLAGAWNPTNLVVESGAVGAFFVGGAGEFTESDVQGLMAMSTASGGFKSGSAVGFNTANAAGGTFDYTQDITDTNGGANALGLVKYGANILNLSGTNTYTGPTVVVAGVLKFAQRDSLYNGNPSNWTDTNLTVNSGGTAAFNVGGAGEFTLAEIQNDLIDLGTATTGFRSGSRIGIDTTNAGANTIYNKAIVNTNGGANALGLMKLGSNTLTLEATGASGDYNGDGKVNAADYTIWRDQDATGGAYTTWKDNFGGVAGALVNTYTGATIVDGGLLHVKTPHMTPAENYSIGSVAGTTGEIIFEGVDITSNAGLMVGENGTGTATINGGTLKFRNDNAGGGQFVGIGRNAGSVGTYTQNGGDLTVGADWFVVGVAGSGTATLNAGSITSSTFALAQTGTASSGIFNINGGLVTTSANMYVVTGTATINQTGGEIKVGTWFTLGETGTAVAEYNISGGKMSTGNVAAENWVMGYNGTATANVSGTADIYVNGHLFCGMNTGFGTLNQSGGTIVATQWSSIGRVGTGIYNMSGGTATFQSDLNVGDYGVGTLNHTGGTIDAAFPIFGWNASGNGTGTIDGASAVLNATGTDGVYVGNYGVGLLELKNGTINTTNASGDFRIANQTSGNGTFNQSGGAVNVLDQSYVGLNGIGVYNMSGGTYSAGDNLYVGLNASGNGTLTQTGGTITSVGNDPSFTGNVIVGNSGVGTYNMDGGTLDMVVGDTGTNNSFSHSLLTQADLLLAQDGNLLVGRNASSVGTLTQTAGTINVAANVSVGSGDIVNNIGATGTVTISGGQMNVGTTSPTGGDFTLGGSSFSTATVNLQGGTLDVTSGSGKIGGALGTLAFNFTGGTLKVNEYNAPDFGGNLGNLVQNGVGSLLDATGNSTLISGASYDLGDGTATIGSGNSLTAVGVLNSAGAGVINLGGGGAAATLDVAAGSVDVDTLNLDNGDVIASLATVRTALSGSGSFSNDLTLDAGNSLNMAINGSTPVTDYDVIDVTNMLTAGGTLNVTLGFTPAANEMFDILNFGSFAGAFGSIVFSAGVWDTSNLTTTGVVTYLSAGAGAGSNVPEPATWSLLAIALAGLLGSRSLRNRRK